tara:strand:+ start:1023 stop:1268 length:246 start_codon:yes stop_codon:yes gene_type:complete
MQTKEEHEYQFFKQDIDLLLKALKDSFESNETNYHVDDLNNSLYIYLEGLEEYSEEEIVEYAAPLFKVLDLDFEHIFLLPF